MSNTRRLRPTSEGEAREFVQLCLKQGISREKIADFLIHLGLNPSLAKEGECSVVSERSFGSYDATDPSMELEIDDALVQEASPIERPVADLKIPGRPKYVTAPETRIVLEPHPPPPRNRPYYKDEELLPSEVALTLAQARMLHNYRRNRGSWLRVAMLVTICAAGTFYALTVNQQAERERMTFALQQARVRNAVVVTSPPIARAPAAAAPASSYAGRAPASLAAAHPAARRAPISSSTTYDRRQR